ncbi:hypothetical protein AB1Y20_011125 [Prymnesium parvum]|uniref:Uncharacterized protein n=1 Tax=Prymnesium parvum TaxID=97485 RepID=A0AB34INE5_PRYPA
MREAAVTRGKVTRARTGELFEPWPWLEGKLADRCRATPKPQAVQAGAPPAEVAEPTHDAPLARSPFAIKKRPNGPGRYDDPDVAPTPRLHDCVPKIRWVDGPGRYDAGGWSEPCHSPKDGQQRRPPSARIGDIIPAPSPRAAARLKAMGLAPPRSGNLDQPHNI